MFPLARLASASEIPLVLGGNLFGYTCSVSESFAVLDAAHEVGVRRIDTADVYSDGASETIIGRWLESRGRQDEWRVYTKVGLRGGSTPERLGAKSTILERTRQSRARLRVDTIHMQQLHHPDPLTSPTETLLAVEELRDVGWITGFGLSNPDLSVHGPHRWGEHLQSVSGVQVFGNWIMRGAIDSVIPRLANTAELLIYGVLGRGVLAGKYMSAPTRDTRSRATMSVRVRRDSTDQALMNLLRRATDITQELGTDLIGVSLEEAWVRNAFPVVGFRKPAQVQDAAARFTERSAAVSEALRMVRNLANSAATSSWDLGNPASSGDVSDEAYA